MKKLIIVIMLIFWGIIGAGETLARYGVSGYFYNGLSPHGSWIEIDYGVVVWRPTIMRVDWSPYTQGRWIWTTDGWYWDSYEPFGYITYHYGRWYFDDYYGWLWYPDYDWAPAWVEWRYDDDYIGWAPLHPYAVFTISVGIHFTTNYYTPYYYWCFVNYNHFYDPYVYNYYVGPKYKYRVYSNTRYRTNYVYRDGRIRNNGVDIDIVRKRTSYDIRRRELVRDADVLSLDKNRNNNDGKVRTYYRTRDELVKNEVRDVKFERSQRKSTLDVTRLDRRDIKKRDRNTSNNEKRVKQDKKREIRNETITRNNRKNTDKQREIKNFEKRKKSGNDFNRNTKIKKDRNSGNLNRKIEKREDVKKKSTFNNNKKNRVQINHNRKKKEIKINRNNNKRKEVKTNRNNQKKQIKVNRNTQRKNTVKTKRNTNNNKRIKVNKNTGRNNTKRKR